MFNKLKDLISNNETFITLLEKGDKSKIYNYLYRKKFNEKDIVDLYYFFLSDKEQFTNSRIIDNLNKIFKSNDINELLFVNIIKLDNNKTFKLLDKFLKDKNLIYFILYFEIALIIKFNLNINFFNKFIEQNKINLNLLFYLSDFNLKKNLQIFFGVDLDKYKQINNFDFILEIINSYIDEKTLNNYFYIKNNKFLISIINNKKVLTEIENPKLISKIIEISPEVFFQIENFHEIFLNLFVILMKNNIDINYSIKFLDIFFIYINKELQKPEGYKILYLLEDEINFRHIDIFNNKKQEKIYKYIIQFNNQINNKKYEKEFKKFELYIKDLEEKLIKINKMEIQKEIKRLEKELQKIENNKVVLKCNLEKLKINNKIKKFKRKFSNITINNIDIKHKEFLLIIYSFIYNYKNYKKIFNVLISFDNPDILNFYIDNYINISPYKDNIYISLLYKFITKKLYLKFEKLYNILIEKFLLETLDVENIINKFINFIKSTKEKMNEIEKQTFLEYIVSNKKIKEKIFLEKSFYLKIIDNKEYQLIFELVDIEKLLKIDLDIKKFIEENEDIKIKEIVNLYENWKNNKDNNNDEIIENYNNEDVQEEIKQEDISKLLDI